MGKVAIVKTGTAVPSVLERRRDFEIWIAAGMGLASTQVQVHSVYLDDELPDPRTIDAAVVTGSPAMVTDRQAWSERTAQWLRQAVVAETPILGICYGHQLLAHALGGSVANNPRGRNIGTVDVQLTEHAQEDALFGGFESRLHLPVSHRQSVTVLPKGATHLATTERDPHHAFVIGRAWGVQFHPEFDADIVRGYIDARRDAIETEGLDADALKASAIDTLHGTLLLRRFANLVLTR